jgi:hypothetical protein
MLMNGNKFEGEPLGHRVNIKETRKYDRHGYGVLQTLGGCNEDIHVASHFATG